MKEEYRARIQAAYDKAMEKAMGVDTTADLSEDLCGDIDWSTLERLATRLTTAPYDYTPAQVAKAVDAVKADRVRLGTPRDNVAYVVSSTTATKTYTVIGDKPCPCRATKPCYHPCAAELYRLWDEHTPPPSLFPMPKTIDERLAGSPISQEMPVETTTMPLEGTEVEYEAIETTRELEAILEPARPLEMPSVALVRTEAAPLTALALEASLAEWTAQRKVITRYIQEQFVRDVDFGKVHFMSKDKCAEGPYRCKTDWHWSKDTLFKPGAEKFTQLFRLTPEFRKDTDTWEMLGSPAGVVCFVCTLRTASGEIVGEGRGARSVKDDYGDVNKTVKMCEKSSQIDAVLRTGALSEVFTQDLETRKEDEDRRATATADKPPPVSREPLVKEILALLRQRGKDPERAWKFAELTYGSPRDALSVAHLEAFKAQILDAMQAPM